jgi:hypothetical protein
MPYSGPPAEQYSERCVGARPGKIRCRGGVYPRLQYGIVAGFRSGHKARIYIFDSNFTQYTILVFVFLAAALFTACGAAQKPAPDPRGALRIEGNPKDANVEVDETHLGPINMFEKQGVLLRPGEHQVVVRADGYFPEYRIVEIGEGEVTVLKIDLRPVPP